MTRTEPPAPNFILRWSIQALAAGVIGAVLVRAFTFFVVRLDALFVAYSLHPVVVAAVAAAVVGSVVYRFAPGASGEGIPAYLESVRSSGVHMPVRDTILKFPAAVLTIACYGSGGAIGPVGRVASGLAQALTIQLQRWFPRLFADHHRYHADYHAPTTAAISGMAAVVAAVFHAPLAGAIFAVEVIQTDKLQYHQLFPAALASVTAVFAARSLGWYAPVTASVPPFVADVGTLLPVVAVALITGGLGLAYTGLYRRIATLFRRDRGSVRVPSLAMGMAATAVLDMGINPALAGTSAVLFARIVSGELSSFNVSLAPGLPIIPTLLLLLIGKIVGNCLTTGSGMSAGFTGPAMLVGALTGAIVGTLLGTTPGSPQYTTLMVAGLAGMLAATVNTPLTAAVLAVELFEPGYGVPAGLSAMIAFQVARFSTIYDVALENR
ncbi:MAG: chloride channel protein [Spirochaetales bacterium]|nr:chloride channel protein [Spirochaetales bacterium]